MMELNAVNWYALALMISVWRQLTQPLMSMVSESGMVQTLGGDRKDKSSTPEAHASLKETNYEQLYLQAHSITVKVIAGSGWGSGILVQKQGQSYSVLTNHHVLNPGKPYRIQTPDGRTYSAYLLEGNQFRHRNHFLGNDLEILQFSSSINYAVASLNPSKELIVGEQVFAAGFPVEANPSPAKGFAFTTGRISLLQDRAFVGGYRIGYTNLIQQGMSGGPLLNHSGEVVAVNGLHAYPVWGNPYTFPDGSQLSPQLQAEIVRSSWAIPIATFVCLTPLTNMSLSVPIKHEELCNAR